MNLSPEATAAWVQAVFSIVAIVAGFAVASYQVRAARRESQAREDEEDRNARQAALALAGLGLRCCERVRSTLADEREVIDGALIQRLKRQVESVGNMLASFPIASLKLRGPIENFAELPGLLDSVADNLREAADTTLKGDPAEPRTLSKVCARIDALCAVARTARDRLEAAVAEADAARR
jgi:hypothetical protein